MYRDDELFDRLRHYTCYPAGRSEPHISCRAERWQCKHGTWLSRCQCGCEDSDPCPECEREAEQNQCEYCGEWTADALIDGLYCSDKCRREDTREPFSPECFGEYEGEGNCKNCDFSDDCEASS